MHAYATTELAIKVYWEQLQRGVARPWPLSPPALDRPSMILGTESSELAEEIGAVVAQHEPVTAGYMLGQLYTALLPGHFRTKHGVFYTPPALTARLLDLASDAGVEWANVRVLDPACGGGAFLTPVALKIVSSLTTRDPSSLLDHVHRHLRGFELDPFGAWMSHVLLEAALLDVCRRAGKRLPQLVTVGDALTMEPDGEGMGLVIGNPPYGRLTLSPELRRRYERSLYGHANAYGLFMDLAVRWTAPGGVIAYVTPTGFLGGRYFKELRSLLAAEAPPLAIDFVGSRKRVFSNVLQETLVASYRRGGTARKASVHTLSLTSDTRLKVSTVGSFSLPCPTTDPWLIPRDLQQAAFIARLERMRHRLSDYGLKVSTGPLVWNRHKPQLHTKATSGSFPIIWAECVTADGRFEYKATRRNHKPYLKPTKDQQWLLTREPCVLVQRTTAKEQRRRLIAAEIPADFVSGFGAVSVENHLNMVKPTNGAPAVSLRAIAAILNSDSADLAFRCMNGSVAVSATELESLPLPPPDAARRVDELLAQGAPDEAIQACVQSLFIGD